MKNSVFNIGGVVDSFFTAKFGATIGATLWQKIGTFQRFFAKSDRMKKGMRKPRNPFK
jgi:hypothetical protein